MLGMLARPHIVLATEILPRLTIRDIVRPVPMDRSHGVHVSDLVREVMLRVDPKTYGREMAQADTENFQESGFFWESLMSGAFASARREGGNLLRAWEVQRDGIYGTPDWFEFDDDGLWLSETKATWKSAREFDAGGIENAFLSPKFVGYLMQVRAYCYLLEIPRVRIHILFMNGNYDRFIPEVRSYELIFTDTELSENWRQLVNAGRKKGWL